MLYDIRQMVFVKRFQGHVLTHKSDSSEACGSYPNASERGEEGLEQGMHRGLYDFGVDARYFSKSFGVPSCQVSDQSRQGRSWQTERQRCLCNALRQDAGQFRVEDCRICFCLASIRQC